MCRPYPSTNSEYTPPVPTSPPSMDSLGSGTEINSDTATEDDDMSPEIGRCGWAQCDYTCGGDHYRCLKCSVPHCVSLVCSRWYGFGGHRRHIQYLKLFKY